MIPSTPSGKALLADWDPEEPGMADRIAAIEREAAQQERSPGSVLSEVVVAYDSGSPRFLRQAIEKARAILDGDPDGR